MKTVRLTLALLIALCLCGCSELPTASIETQPKETLATQESTLAETQESTTETTSTEPPSAPTAEPTATSTPEPTEADNDGTTVWISTKGGTKYHKRPTCSNMSNPAEVTRIIAEQRGFTPCKKCYK